jgi:hypothetical protein
MLPSHWLLWQEPCRSRSPPSVPCYWSLLPTVIKEGPEPSFLPSCSLFLSCVETFHINKLIRTGPPSKSLKWKGREEGVALWGGAQSILHPICSWALLSFRCLFCCLELVKTLTKTPYCEMLPICEIFACFWLAIVPCCLCTLWYLSGLLLCWVTDCVLSLAGLCVLTCLFTGS